MMAGYAGVEWICNQRFNCGSLLSEAAPIGRRGCFRASSSDTCVVTPILATSGIYFNRFRGSYV